MKRNFQDLTDIEIENFTPLLYMIMGKEPEAEGWTPLAWQPASTEDGETYPGRLYEPDAQIEPMSEDPFDLYDRETAVSYVVQDVLRIGMMNQADGKTTPKHYRIVPVYTGLEHLLQPRVMIFCESPNGTIAPCREWPADAMDDEERTPLCQMFGFSRCAEDDHSYNIPIYTPAKAHALIIAQTVTIQEMGEQGWRFFTVPVSIAD